MPSKGIKCYTYNAVQGVEIEFSVPKQNLSKRDNWVFTSDQIEVDKKNLSTFDFAGTFDFRVRRDGRELTRQWIEINAMTGALGDGTMKNMEQTPSVFAEDLIICYGFYDAGPGHAGLPKQHQCYVTVTRNWQDWMRDVAAPGSTAADKPLSRWVLPSAHDMGMNSMTTSLAILQKAGTGVIKEVLGRDLPGALSVLNKVSDAAVNHIAPDIIRALAITQKDSLETVLKIGARYFEFRPAKCHRQFQRVSPLPDDIYFQHGAIPGMPYKQFLHDIAQFLSEHKDEVIVVQNRWDGVPPDCPRATDDELRNILNDALKGRDISVGGADDLKRSVKDLRRDKKRLIMTRDLNQISNYDDAASATLDGAPIVDKLKDMARDPPRGRPVILLQCQATATNIRDVIVASVMDSDVSTSPLLATKAICDAKIMPLLRGDTGRALVREEGVAVVLNDFFDGGTADTAVGMSRERLK
ncbi:PLC-like phosphodiesterase [Polyplosphaeria fusca]|uniref:PLC-like phosphodiesterase n=1 Tax=Polyplosphaeria fusca TaxID=682080 RepID=A0A9P4R5K3_9PLEO|nr:PLC-like phosphodiesterase [Polyplosphaeria fusca]